MLLRVITLTLVLVATRCVKQKSNFRKYDEICLSFGFIDIDIDGEERPQCLFCTKFLDADSLKRNKLKKHLETVHAECIRENKTSLTIRSTHFQK